MNRQDFLNGLEDAEKLCRRQAPQFKRGSRLSNSRTAIDSEPATTPESFDLQRAAAACALAAKLLKGSMLLERYNSDREEKRRETERQDFREFCEELGAKV